MSTTETGVLQRSGEDRRREDRRKLYGKPFLAMLLGGLPEDRRKEERRKGDRRQNRAPWPPAGTDLSERRSNAG